MKTLIAATILVASVTSVSATANPEIARYIGDEQAATLTEAQTLSVLNVIHSGDSESDKHTKLRSLILR